MSDDLKSQMETKVKGSKVEPYIAKIDVVNADLFVDLTQDYSSLEEERKKLLHDLLIKVWRSVTGNAVSQVMLNPASRWASGPLVEHELVDEEVHDEIEIETDEPAKVHDSSLEDVLPISEEVVRESESPQIETEKAVNPYSASKQSSTSSRTKSYKEERSAAKLVTDYGVAIRKLATIVACFLGLLVLIGAGFEIWRGSIINALVAVIVSSFGILFGWFFMSLMGALYVVCGGVMTALADIADTLSSMRAGSLIRQDDS